MKIEIRNLTKYYGNKKALDKVSLTFKTGYFYGILGPNGAGKSTLINTIIGNLLGYKGNYVWTEKGKRLNEFEIKGNLGVVFQDNKLDPLLSVKENLFVRGKMYGLSKAQINKNIEEINKYIYLHDIKNQKYITLSGGQKRRVEIARALINNPKILILDEPTTGLDPQTRDMMWKAILRLHKEKKLTIILVSHYLEEMQNCDSIAVLFNGKIKYFGSIGAFISSNSKTDLILSVKEVDHIDTSLKEKYNYIWLNNNTFKFEDLSVKDMIQILSFLNKKNNVINFDIKHATLQDAYLKVLAEYEEDGN